MNDQATFNEGEIVFATIPFSGLENTEGKNEKVRPAVVFKVVDEQDLLVLPLYSKKHWSGKKGTPIRFNDRISYLSSDPIEIPVSNVVRRTGDIANVDDLRGQQESRAFNHLVAKAKEFLKQADSASYQITLDGLNKAIASRNKFTVQEVEELKKWRDRVLSQGSHSKTSVTKAPTQTHLATGKTQESAKGKYPHQTEQGLRRRERQRDRRETRRREEELRRERNEQGRKREQRKRDEQRRRNLGRKKNLVHSRFSSKSFAVGDIIYAETPFDETPFTGKDRPVIVVAVRGNKVIVLPLYSWRSKGTTIRFQGRNSTIRNRYIEIPINKVRKHTGEKVSADHFQNALAFKNFYPFITKPGEILNAAYSMNPENALDLLSRLLERRDELTVANFIKLRDERERVLQRHERRRRHRERSLQASQERDAKGRRRIAKKRISPHAARKGASPQRPSTTKSVFKPPRIHQLATELRITSEEVLALCRALGIEAQSNSSTISEKQARQVRQKVSWETSPDRKRILSWWINRWEDLSLPMRISFLGKPELDRLVEFPDAVILNAIEVRQKLAEILEEAEIINAVGLNSQQSVLADLLLASDRVTTYAALDRLQRLWASGVEITFEEKQSLTQRSKKLQERIIEWERHEDAE